MPTLIIVRVGLGYGNEYRTNGPESSTPDDDLNRNSLALRVRFTFGRDEEISVVQEINRDREESLGGFGHDADQRKVELGRFSAS